MASRPHIPCETNFGVDEVTALIPMYHVVLLDDDDHSYEYVIEMLMGILGRAETKNEMACEVDKAKRVIVETTYKEGAGG